MKPPHPYDIGSAKELCELLGMSRPALNRAIARAVDPLPVGHLSNGRIVAVRAEVLAWHARQVRRNVEPAANDVPTAESA